MSYEPTEWKAGDTVTSAKLNKMEQGIVAGGVTFVHMIYPTFGDISGGGGLIVKSAGNSEQPTVTLDKSWKEISDASEQGIIIVVNEISDPPYKNFAYLTDISLDEDYYYASFMSLNNNIHCYSTSTNELMIIGTPPENEEELPK